MSTDLKMLSDVNQDKRCLVLIRTPFQAWLVEKVLEAERVSSYDLLYLTQDNSTEDQFYYSRIAQRAFRAKYILVKRKRWDFLNHVWLALAAWPFVFKRRYNTTFVSSIDSYVLNAIANRRCVDHLVTFDDGTANYNQSSSYYNEPSSIRGRIYKKIFLAKSIIVTKEKISRHYTVQPQLNNIVGGSRLRKVDLWSRRNIHRSEISSFRSYFIGAPFGEIFNSDQIKRLENLVREIGIDVYVRHPREVIPLDLGAPFLRKNGRIAEEAILKDAGHQPILLIGSLSSVMFNLARCADRRVVFVPYGSLKNESLVNLAIESGCKVVQVDIFEDHS